MKYKIVLLFFVLLNISCSHPVSKPLPPDSFLKESYEVRSFLKRALSVAPKGVKLETPADGVNALDVNWPGEALVKSVEENQPWKSQSHYHFMLDLGETDLVTYYETDSNTVTASVLLDYYFSRLDKLGFKPAGEPHIFLSYPIQFANNSWFKEQSNITVASNVYINVEAKKALITVDIFEIY